LAGIANSDFSDYLAVVRSGTKKSFDQMCKLRNRSIIGGTSGAEYYMTYSMWPIKKHQEVLSELGLSYETPKSMNNDDIQVYLTRPGTIKELKRQIELRVSTRGSARSYAFLSRCDTLVSASYLLWDKIYWSDDSKYSLKDLIDKALESNDTGINLPAFFPFHADYDYMIHLCSMEKGMNVKPYRQYKRMGVFTKILSTMPNERTMKHFLRRHWYNDTTSMDDAEYEYYNSALKNIMPWLSETPEETMDNLGYDNLHVSYKQPQISMTCVDNYLISWQSDQLCAVD
jgi:hypothetical protein